MELKNVTEYEIGVLGLLKDLENLEGGDFENLNEKVEGFIRGSYEAEYSFDEEKFRACLESLCERDYIKGAYYGDELDFEVDGIAPAGLEILAEMETAATKEEKKGRKISILSNNKLVVNIRGMKLFSLL